MKDIGSFKLSPILLLVPVIILAWGSLSHFKDRRRPETRFPGDTSVIPPSSLWHPDKYTGRWAQCVVVGDSDEFTILNEDGSKERIRMLMIVGPERSSSFFKKAKHALYEKLQNRMVYLVPASAGTFTKDASGPTLAYVLEGGKNINLEMIREGWVQYVAEEPLGPWPTEFESADKEARSLGKGMWQNRPSR